MSTESLPFYKKEERPWGFFEQFTLNTPSTVKLLSVRSGEALSLQTHAKRDEFWHVLSGEGVVTIGDSTQKVHAQKEFFIPRGTAHRAEALEHDLWMLEISFGDFDEEDIVRLKDRYGRT
ncbi:MAG: phosphomannose isomerase type II C-terminal cupin domain [Patescibacteria group bacterium]|nr:phosphomannose isomerase type II C-terminal cupin domain [Patescibacteria group bacterium]